MDELVVFEIHDRKSGDHIVIKARNIGEVRKIAKAETKSRGWEDENYWSRKII